MRIKATALMASAICLLAVQAVQAHNVVGYNTVVVPANSDAFLTVPFNQVSQGEFIATGTDADGVQTTGLSGGAYDSTYYVRFITGNAAGLWISISSNTATEVVLDGTVPSERTTILGLVAAGDRFRIYKHHTLGSFFQPALLGTSFLNQTQVLIYENNTAAMAKNKSAAKIATYFTSLSRWLGAGITNDTVLVPETQFVVRNNSTTQSLTIITIGLAPDYKISQLIAADGDLVINSGYPVPLTLNTSGLAGNQRQVLFFDNAATGKNKSAVKIATYFSSLNRWLGAGVTGKEQIKPSEAITLRLPASEVGTIVTWTVPY